MTIRTRSMTPGRGSEPLKTKIVATIGPDGEAIDPKRRNDRVFGPDDKEYRRGDLSYADLVDWFYKEGVDIIRLNHAHVREEKETKRVFREIKAGLAAAEHRKTMLETSASKHVAVLSDLPGPKIRFDFQKIPVFERGQQVLISFRETPEEKAHTVRVDERPLADALGPARPDPILERCVRSLYEETRDASWNEQERGAFEQQVENITGVSLRRPDPGSERLSAVLAALLDRIESRLDEEEPLLAFVGDGEIVLEVLTLDKDAATLTCEVLTAVGGFKKKRPGFTLKGIDLDVATFTQADENIARWLLQEEHTGYTPIEHKLALAFIALSFVQTADDVLRARELIERTIQDSFNNLASRFAETRSARLLSPSLVAKIETGKGFSNRKHILDVVDAIMVARGDMGLQTAVEEVPALQKRLIRLCNLRGKPVITATQMLKSMEANIEPTRAEATDVFNAINDGTDALMTSEETASGLYPCRTLAKMGRIAAQAEAYYELTGVPEPLRSERRRERIQTFLLDDAKRIQANHARIERAHMFLKRLAELLTAETGVADSTLKTIQWRRDLYGEKVTKAALQGDTNRITEAACTMAESIEASSILAPSTSGRTIRMISRIRPRVPIIGAAHDIVNRRKLAISYGVIPLEVRVGNPDSVQDLFKACEQARVGSRTLHQSVAPPGSTTIFVCGTPAGTPGTTNLINLRKLA